MSDIFLLVQCSPEVVIIDSSSEEEQDGDSFSEEDWSADESELKGEKLIDHIAQVESDQIFARCLEEEINGEFHDTEGEEEEHDIDPNIMSFTSHANELDQVYCTVLSFFSKNTLVMSFFYYCFWFH